MTPYAVVMPLDANFISQLLFFKTILTHKQLNSVFSFRLIGFGRK